jgi:ribose/xylose/arabinose/galactoside ABC-type transport system permease subunit
MTIEQKAQTPAVSVSPKKNRATNLSSIRKVWPWFFLVAMVIVFTISAKVTNGTNFISVRSIQGILTYATQIALIGMGETLIMIAVGIDMSSGYMLGLSSIVSAEVMKALYKAGVDPVLTIVLGMSGGILICIIPGWINGWLVARIKVPSFIATLGVGYAIYGAALVESQGYPVAEQPPYLGQLGNGFVFYYWPDHGLSLFKIHAAATQADMTSIVALVPNVVLITLIVVIMVWFLLAKTQFGQHLYAIGGNYQAAVRAGIPVNRTLIKAFVITAMLSGVAGALWASRFTSGDSNAGVPSLLYAIAAVVVGGASMFGGEGTIIGTVIGSLIIGTIQYGLVIVGVSSFWQYLAVGVIVVIAVIVDQFGRTLER